MISIVRYGVALFLLSACAGEEGQNDGDDDDAVTDGDTDDGGTATYLADASVGFVVVTSGEVPANGPSSTATAATAGFSTIEGQQTECTRVTLSEDCSDVTCTLSGASIPSFTLFSAGVIDIAGLREPVQLLEGDGVYEGFYQSFYVSNDASYFLPGEDVTATASGDAVPPLTLTATTPDQNLVLIEPSISSRASLVSVPVGADLRYEWVAPSTGKITVALDVLTGSPTETRRISCSRLGAPLVNEVVIPLSQKDIFNAGTTALERIVYTSDATTVAGAFEVIFELGAPVVTQDGVLFTPRTLSFY